MVDDNLFEKHMASGEEALKGMDLEQAWQEFESASECNPASGRPLNRLGVVLCRRGEFEEACEYFNRALEAEPLLASAYNNLGNAKLEMGDLEAARSYYQKALAIDPDHPSAHHNLGVVYRKQGKIHLAVPELKRGQKLLDKRERSQFTDRQKMIGTMGIAILLVLLLGYVLLFR